ncbi:Aste57867_7127 [Aphanomyces stellatus]|uniref:Aste57867_7020 protein n=1 Tax=Aphanomyces stellatus TaxID=120398 RepID=A0A485KGV8_9STRA|nr:hypothetical protein As57867_007103 [Aphanomyces stellatus]KAF0705540.1 hypothetical protein As57867_006997 [Aphanomyces stellatus]VFT83969.1 Aste57867_7020 [Aphanomyces stellatus]VFT84059.1 Aste57867_7127 [Aphanomyces stellatus]
MDALLVVARYIRRMNQASSKKLFCLTSIESTIEFSRLFAEQDAEMRGRWQEEDAAMKRRMTSYMDQVHAKQTHVAKLRAQLPTLRAENEAARLAVAPAEASEAQERAYWKYHCGRRYTTEWYAWRKCQTAARAARGAWNQTYRQLQSQEQQIADTIQVPPFVTSPLPETKDKALSVLFFFMIPPHLNVLSRLAAAAQYTLVPRPPGHVTSVNSISVPSPPTSWAQHYNMYSNATLECPSAVDRHWIIYPKGLAVPRQWGPSTVDGIVLAHPSFWFPTGFDHGAVWAAGLNPLLCPREKTIEFFTHQLNSTTDRHLQWALECPQNAHQGASDRGNLVYANIHMKPTTFSKKEFIAFGSLRSFPNQQMRKLLQYQYTRSLPLEQDVVLQLIRQTMFHVGALSDEDQPTMLWKRELDQGGLKCWLSVLTKLSEQLRDTPRQYKAFLAATEMTKYVSQFEPNMRPLVRAFVDIAKGWAQLVRDQAEVLTVTPKERLELRAKECLMYGYAIVGQNSAGEFTAADTRDLVKLVVLFRNGLQFGRGSLFESDLMAIEVYVHEAMLWKHFSIAGRTKRDQTYSNNSNLEKDS